VLSKEILDGHPGVCQFLDQSQFSKSEPTDERTSKISGKKNPETP
jgi:hypothetical protein